MKIGAAILNSILDVVFDAGEKFDDHSKDVHPSLCCANNRKSDAKDRGEGAINADTGGANKIREMGDRKRKTERQIDREDSDEIHRTQLPGTQYQQVPSPLRTRGCTALV